MAIEKTTLSTDICGEQLRALGQFIDQQQRRLATELWEMRKERQQIKKAIRESFDELHSHELADAAHR